MAEKARISIIVPVLNEEQAVPIFLDKVVPMLEAVCREQLDGAAFEIVFIDDGSTDRTAEASFRRRQRDPKSSSSASRAISARRQLLPPACNMPRAPRSCRWMSTSRTRPKSCRAWSSSG